ncbi:MAG: ubiquinol oxidase subunit II [bacterium]|nr:ubiquinol oxidase subunit II [bacterium]MDN5835311.1 ubiquinol oxidase subunit II [bacterium]
MKTKLFLTLGLVVIVAVLLTVYLTSGVNVEILNPKGIIAEQQRDLIVLTVFLGLFVVIPVYIMTIFIIFRYHEGNKKAKYSPNFSDSLLAETIWWGIPIIIIVFLSIVTVVSTFKLDPHKPIVGDKDPLQVQVVSLDWKWLFIYPEESVASVNYAVIPEGRPVDFALTSDTVMNSFWVPQLAGQIYNMPGMITHLNISADKGSYNGSSANISGEGFAGMKFVIQATDQNDYKSWIKKAQASDNQLSQSAYDELYKPSKNNSVEQYSNVRDHLFNDVVNKYMMPDMSKNHSSEGDK